MKTRAAAAAAAAAVTCLCLGVALSPCLAAPPLADRLPGGTLVYVGWAGKNLTFDGSLVGQMLSDPAVEGILGMVKDALGKQIGQQDQREAVLSLWSMGGLAWQHPIAAALLDIRQAGDGPPVPSVVVLIDLGKDKEAFTKHLDALLDKLKNDLPFAAATIGAQQYQTISIAQGVALSYGYMGNVLFLAVGDTTVKDLVEVVPAKNLQADKGFAECLKDLGEQDMQFGYYVNVAALNERIESLRGRGAAAASGPGGAAGPAGAPNRLVQALGLEKVTATGGVLRIADRGMYTRSRIFSPGPHRGLLMPLSGPAIAEADLADVPEDADFAVVFKLSPDAAFAQLRSTLESINPGADKELGKTIDDLGRALGVSLVDDVLKNLGDTWVIASAPSLGGSITGTLLTVQAKDPAKLAAAIDKIEAKIAPPGEAGGEGGPAIRRITAGRAEIRCLAIPSREPIPVAPAWAIYKNKLYLAAFPQVIQAAVAAEGGRSIAQDAAFQKARARISDKPSCLVYVNLPKLARQVYPLALVGWTVGANVLAGQTGLPVKPEWLPPITSVEKHLLPQICTISSDARGIVFEGYGSLPSPSVAAGLVINPAWASLLAPAVEQAAGRAADVSQANELRQVAMALKIYEMDQGRMPASLKDEKLLSYLGGPGGNLARNIAAGRYAYVPPAPAGRGEANAAQSVMVYMAEPKGGNTPVAFGDGHVEMVPAGRLAELLKPLSAPGRR